ncbi:MAG: AMP-binding protein, partial [Oscillospiraceae bacterium]|nr:AMP-binding protein [Oscillospiraceae bacterium]
PIGKPIDNVKVYVVNRHGQLQPIGLPGELWLGGRGLARGYIHDEERTAERFAPDPFCPGQRIYKTGDLGMWLPDGNLLYLGRNDHQVKVRGNRVELGEIDALIRQLDCVKDCAVILRPDSRGDNAIFAYISAAEELDLSGIKEMLSSKLPSYMIPAAMMQLPSIPYTANGKLDPLALPVVDQSDLTSYIEPRTDTERLLCQVFSKVLGIEQVGIKDSFFERGGHSLLVVSLLNEIETQIGLRPSFRDIFHCPTVEELAAFLTARNADQAAIIPTAEKREYYPASNAQKNIYLAQQRDPDSTVYHIPLSYSVSGSVDPVTMEMALRMLLRRHEPLRTAFRVFDGEICQVISERAEIAVPILSLDENASFEDAFQSFVKPFDLSQAPLVRASIVKKDGEIRLFIDLHHIIADGASMPILLQDLARLYAGEALPAPKLQYKDFSQWLGAQDFSELQDRWKEACREIPEAPDLPTDHVGRALSSSQIQLPVGSALLTDLQRVASSAKTTLHNVLLFAAMLTMERFSGQKKLSVGIPVSMRSAVNLGDMIGMLVNVLPVSCDFSVDRSVLQQIKELEQKVLFANQGVLCDLQSMQNAAPPVRVVFSYERGVPTTLKLGEAKLSTVSNTQSTAKYDLIIGATEEAQELMLTISYAKELYEEATAWSMLNSFHAVLQELSVDPQILCSEISARSEEQTELLHSYAGSIEEDPTRDSVLDRIRSEAVLHPDATALVYECRRISYRTMMQKADAYAFQFAEQSVGSGDLVAVLLEDGIEAICVLLGICLTGAAYLPLDIHTPDARIGTILENSGCKFVVTDSVNCHRIHHCRSILAQPQLRSEQEFVSRARLSDVAYVIYTSGSTGVPKGVEITHSGLKNLVCWHLRQFELSCNDVTTRFAGFGFDASVWEIFPSLAVGASIHVIPQSMRLDLNALCTYYNEQGITVSFLPTPICEQFLKLECPKLRILLTGGDKLNHFETQNGYRLFNNYGPTENTVVATACEVLEACSNIPIGRPITN